MNQTSTYSYLALTLKKQILKLIEKIPKEDELTITKRGELKLKRNGEEQALRLTSQQQSSGIEEYLDEFREWRDDKVELPTIEGSTEAQLGPNVEDKLVRLAKRTVILFDIVGLSYLSLRRLTPRTLQNLSNEKFEGLISGAREIVAERLAPPTLLEALLGDFTLPNSPVVMSHSSTSIIK
ncbi:11131_t:CDS:2 [Entrophospora sp. SA101]|nr:11131_t:CDS:2 [Entrophospora sp. SA101]